MATVVPERQEHDVNVNAGGRWRWALARVDWGIAALLGLLTLGLAAYRAGAPGLHNDEPYSVALALQPLSFMAQLLWGHEAFMSGYYLLLHVWLGALQTFGITQTEFLIRLPSVVAAAASAVILYNLGARYWGRIAGVVAVVAFAANPLQLYMAQNARSYSIQVLLHILAWYAFLGALHATDARSRRRWWIAFIAAATLAIYFQVDSVVAFVAFPVALAVLAAIPSPWRKRARQALRPFALSVVAIGALTTPLALDVIVHGSSNSQVGAATFAQLWSLFADNMAYGDGQVVAFLMIGVAAAALSTLPALLWGAFRRWWPWRYDAETSVATLAIACWFIVPLALFWLLTQNLVNLHLFWWRYMVILVAPLSLLIGVGVSRLRLRPIALALATLVLLLTLRHASYYYNTTYDAGNNIGVTTAMTWLIQHHQQGDGLICSPSATDGTACSMSVDYYLRNRYQGPDPWPTAYPGNWIGDSTPSIPDQESAVLAYAAQHNRIFLVGGYYGDVTTQRLHVQALLSALEADGFTVSTSYDSLLWQVILLVRTPA